MMDEPPNPLENTFNKMRDVLEKGLPDAITLPREEFIRAAHSHFWTGAASMMQGVCSLIIAMEGRDHTAALSAFIDVVTHQIVTQSKMTLPQIIATIAAHNPEVP
jgi:hypothetical protein